MQIRRAYLHTTFSVQLGRTRPPACPPSHSRLGQTPQTGSEAPRHFPSPFKMGLLFPEAARRSHWLLLQQPLQPSSPPPLQHIKTLRGRCFDTEFCLTLFLPPDQPKNQARHNEAIFNMPIVPPSSCEIFHAYRAPAASHRLLLLHYSATSIYLITTLGVLNI